MAVNKPRKHDTRFERVSESAYFFNMWRGRRGDVRIPYPRFVNAPVQINRSVEQKSLNKQIRVLAERLCAEHPSISLDTEVLNGTPHIKGTRLSVRTILGKLYLHGSVQAIVDIYEPHLSEEQVKEAIAYAQDFMEIARDPSEP